MSLPKLPPPKDAVALDSIIGALKAIGSRMFLLPPEESEHFALLTVHDVMCLSDAALALDVWKRLDLGMPRSNVVFLANSDASQVYKAALLSTRANNVHGAASGEMLPVVLNTVTDSPRYYFVRAFKNMVLQDHCLPEQKQRKIVRDAQRRDAPKRRTTRRVQNDVFDAYCEACSQGAERAAAGLIRETLIEMELYSPSMAAMARLIVDGMSIREVAEVREVAVQAVYQARQKFRRLLIEKRSLLKATEKRPVARDSRGSKKSLEEQADDVA